MLSTLVLHFFFSVVISTVGHIFFNSKNSSLTLLEPILGFSILLLIISGSFIVNLSTVTISIIFLFLTILLKPFLVKKINYKIILQNSYLLIFSLIISYSPYFLVNKNLDFQITGFTISNDTVLHAAFSRNCKENISIHKKLFFSDNYCIPRYPLGAHSVVNLTSNILNIETSKLIMPVALFFNSLNVFIITYFLLKLLKKERGIAWVLSPFLTSTYFYLAIAYHGFLPQSSFVAFVLAFSILLFKTNLINLSNKKLIISLSLLISASISIYSFISFLSIITLILSFLFYNRKYLKQNLNALLRIAIISAIMLNFNILIFFRDLSDLFKIAIGESVIFAQSKFGGNIKVFLDNRVGSAVWLEKDYRYIRISEFKLFFHSISNSILLISIAQFFKSIIKFKYLFYILLSFIFLYYFIYGLTFNPYGLVRIQSLIFIFIPILFSVFLINNLPKQLGRLFIFLYIVLIMVSNFILLENISMLNFRVLENLKKLDVIIGNKKTLFTTTNDWALYYVDSESVDITDLTYRRDDNINSCKSDYEIFIRDGYPNLAPNCAKKSKIGGYYVCEL